MRKFPMGGFVVVIVASLFLMAAYSFLHADTGWEGATRIERGSYINVRKVTASSNTPTLLFDSSVLRPDGFCQNNSANTVWIGTVSATWGILPHPNWTNGVFVKSSDSFVLDGSLTGAVYFVCDTGVGSCEMRCLDGLVR